MIEHLNKRLNLKLRIDTEKGKKTPKKRREMKDPIENNELPHQAASKQITSIEGISNIHERIYNSLSINISVP